MSLDFSQWVGMTIAVLTILVTVLITWQIWQVVNLNNIENRIKSTFKKSAIETYAALAEMHSDIAISVASNNRFDYFLHEIMRISYLAKAGKFKDCERLIRGMGLIRTIPNQKTSKGEMLRHAFNSIENKHKILNISNLESLINEFIEEQDNLMFSNKQ